MKGTWAETLEHLATCVFKALEPLRTWTPELFEGLRALDLADSTIKAGVSFRILLCFSFFEELDI